MAETCHRVQLSSQTHVTVVSEALQHHQRAKCRFSISSGGNGAVPFWEAGLQEHMSPTTSPLQRLHITQAIHLPHWQGLEHRQGGVKKETHGGGASLPPSSCGMRMA